jgi:dTDP-4-amino-4,6-dideoxygalactose transaminase
VTDLPALLGGAPVRPQGPPDWPPDDAEIRTAVAAALADGSWGRYHAGHVERLEAELARYHGVEYALTCASGTLAVELALRALNPRPGDEVLLAAYDYEPNFLAVHAAGARPVLVDLKAANWNLDVGRVEAALSPGVRALIVSHLHGGLVPMRDLMELAARRDFAVIEDACQATGATVQGRPAGAWGDVGVLSFGGSKLLSAGRGGALLTSRPDLHQRLRIALRRGVQQWAALSEIQAVALLPQLGKLDERNARRSANARRLTELLAGLPGLAPFANPGVEGEPAFYKLGFRFDESAFGLSRSRFVEAVRAEGVALDEGFRAVHAGRSPGRYRAAGDLVEADRAHRGCVVLHHPVLLGTGDDVDQVARAVRRAYLNAGPLSV